MREAVPPFVILTKVRIHEHSVWLCKASCSWMLNQVQHDGGTYA